MVTEVLLRGSNDTNDAVELMHGDIERPNIIMHGDIERPNIILENVRRLFAPPVKTCKLHLHFKIS